MKKICTNCTSDERWLPTPISIYEEYLIKYIKAGNGVQNIRAIRKNIAYNLQYLEFQIQLLNEFNVTQVILTQTWKVFIIIGTGIIEAILYYLLTSKKLAKSTNWLEIASTGNEVNVEGKQYRIENVIYEKLASLIPVDMTFDTMIKKVESKKLLGNGHEIYKKLQYLRKLRNRVHLHLIEEEYDTDWKKFNLDEINTMKLVLYSFMISSFFSPTLQEKKLFNFLR